MAWRICASTKWPMRHLAITGMETAAWMPLIIFGSLMRLTPPAARMSAGMRSRAMTAQAPASSAMRACSGVVTSMITPPFSIWARLRFNSCLFCSMILFSFYCLIFCLGWQRDCFGEGIGKVGQRWKPLTQLVGSEGATSAPTPCSAVESRWVSFPSVS